MDLQAVKQRFGIIGRSKGLDQALSTAIRVAPTDLTVLITGESGVGKEVISTIIHSLSPRKHNKFIAVNCGAIPSGTINSELFGHEKGAFTGATSDRKGYFETVDEGTIFLDEISEMPLDTQSYLLRILESGEYMRVGSSKVQKTDVRIIAASNVNLLKKVEQNKFREDLYYRLNTVPIHIPPLRERREDIYMLFRKFVVDFAEKYRSKPIELEPKAKELLLNYRWPGNIRQLRNVARQLSVLSEDKTISADQLIDLLPSIRDRHLPIPMINGGDSDQMQEREILYKLLFEMKSDLNDLKTLVFELIQSNNLRVPDLQKISTIKSLDISRDELSNKSVEELREEFQDSELEHASSKSEEYKPILLDPEEQERINKMEVIEENLSLEEMEKEMIKKALKKHNGRRKDAADELGISERTLYRKIKHYDLQ